MVEVDTTYPWQTQLSVDARVLWTSAPTSHFRTQSEFDLACVSKVCASRRNAARCQLTLLRPVVLLRRHLSADITKSTAFSLPSSGMFHRALISGQWKASKHIMPTWVSPYLCRFFVFEKHLSAANLSIN